MRRSTRSFPAERLGHASSEKTRLLGNRCGYAFSLNLYPPDSRIRADSEKTAQLRMRDNWFYTEIDLSRPVIAPFAAPLEKIFTELADAAIRAAEAGAVSLIGDDKAGSILCLRCNKNIRRLADLNGARTPW